MYPLTSSDRLASFSPNGCKLLVFWGSKIRFNILSSHISNFWLFCLSRHVTLVEVSVPLDGASEYSKVWLTQPISSGAKAVSQAQQLSKLRKECVYFQTKTQPTEQVLKRSFSELCFPLKIFDQNQQKPKSMKCKKLKLYPRNSRRFITVTSHGKNLTSIFNKCLLYRVNH